MRLLLDQDVYAATIRFLKELSHDVLTATEINLSRATDSELLLASIQRNRIFITRDRDFGALVYAEGLGTGVIYLRFAPSILNSGHQQLKIVLQSYSEDELRSAFVVVEPGRYRYRRLS